MAIGKRVPFSDWLILLYAVLPWKSFRPLIRLLWLAMQSLAPHQFPETEVCCKRVFKPLFQGTWSSRGEILAPPMGWAQVSVTFFQWVGVCRASATSFFCVNTMWWKPEVVCDYRYRKSLNCPPLE